MKKRWLPVLLLCLLVLCLCAALYLPETETVQLEGTLL